MSDPWDDNFDGSGALDGVWTPANAPVSPLRVSGECVFSILADASTHTSGLMRALRGFPTEAQYATRDYVTRFSIDSAAQGNFLAVGMGIGSLGNGPGSCFALILGSEGGVYFWKVLQMNSYTSFGGELARSAAVAPGISGGYIRIRIPADPVHNNTLFQYSLDARTWVTLYSWANDYTTYPSLYLMAAPGSAVPVTARYSWVRSLPLGAAVLQGGGFFPLI